MISRARIQKSIVQGLAHHPAVALLGPRQCGKTTLARQVAAREGARIFDLENPDDAAALENPMLALESLRGLVVLDEVQRRPELFPVLRVLMDRESAPAKFLLLGSASPFLVRSVTESLAAGWLLLIYRVSRWMKWEWPIFPDYGQEAASRGLFSRRMKIPAMAGGGILSALLSKKISQRLGSEPLPRALAGSGRWQPTIMGRH